MIDEMNRLIIYLAGQENRFLGSSFDRNASHNAGELVNRPEISYPELVKVLKEFFVNLDEATKEDNGPEGT